jgi:hypothetical protein
MKDGEMLSKDENVIDPHEKADDPITRRRLSTVGIAMLQSYRRLRTCPGAGLAPASLAKGGIVTELNNSRQCYFLAVAVAVALPVAPSALRK